MDGDFGTALAAWDALFSAVAGVSATLIGLLFVALGLNPRIMADDGPTGLRVWSSHTFHSFLVLLILGIAGLVPASSRETLAVTLTILAAQGIVRVIVDTRRISHDPDRRWSGRHALLRFVAPGLAYVAMALAAFGVWHSDPDALGWLIAVVFLLTTSALASCWEILKAVAELPAPDSAR
jgi:hypothetical protein